MSVSSIQPPAQVVNHQPVTDLVEQRLVDSFFRVSRSRTFRRSRRLIEALKFLVPAAGEGRRLDQADVARGVFGKASEEFDPSIDTGVRVLFSRLRARLEEYYGSEGAGDPWRLAVRPRDYNLHLAQGADADGEPQPKQECPAPAGRAETPDEDGSLAAPPAERCALAVLPFANLTNDPAQDAFCHGLTDELISGMTPWEVVDVLSRGASFQYAGESMDARAVGEELGVAMALEGSVRMEEDRTRVTVQLSSTESGFSVWSASFEGEEGESLDVAKALTKAILGKLHPVLADGLGATAPEEVTEVGVI